MSYPQLVGRTAESSERAVGRPILTALLVLAAILAVVAWRLLPQPAARLMRSEPVDTVKQAPPVTGAEATNDRQLHLAHAEREIIAAAEQLAAARRLLAALGPALDRNYLQSERRQAERARTATDGAQRSIEQALEDIRFTSRGKE